MFYPITKCSLKRLSNDPVNTFYHKCITQAFRCLKEFWFMKKILLLFTSLLVIQFSSCAQQFTFDYIDVGRRGDILRGKKASTQHISITPSHIIYTNEKGGVTRFMIHRRDQIDRGHTAFMISCECAGSDANVNEAHLLRLGRNKILFMFFEPNVDFTAFGNYKFFYNPNP